MSNINYVTQYQSFVDTLYKWSIQNIMKFKSERKYIKQWSNSNKPAKKTEENKCNVRNQAVWDNVGSDMLLVSDYFYTLNNKKLNKKCQTRHLWILQY